MKYIMVWYNLGVVSSSNTQQMPINHLKSFSLKFLSTAGLSESLTC